MLNFETHLAPKSFGYGNVELCCFSRLCFGKYLDLIRIAVLSQRLLEKLRKTAEYHGRDSQ